MTQPTFLIRIADYDEGIDQFTIAAFGFTPEDEEMNPEYCKSAPDFDDFTVPGIALPALIGEYGEPADLVGRVFALALPEIKLGYETSADSDYTDWSMRQGEMGC